eukprot:1147147-Pelagomonas_calceolata.AAC.1
MSGTPPPADTGISRTPAEFLKVGALAIPWMSLLGAGSKAHSAAIKGKTVLVKLNSGVDYRGMTPQPESLA